MIGPTLNLWTTFRIFQTRVFGGVLIRTPTVKEKEVKEEIRSRLCCESLATAQTSVLKPSVPSHVSTQSRANQIRYHDPTTPNLCMLLANNHRAKAASFKHQGDLQSAGHVRSLTAPTATVWLLRWAVPVWCNFHVIFVIFFPLLIYFKGFQSLQGGSAHVCVHSDWLQLICEVLSREKKHEVLTRVVGCFRRRLLGERESQRDAI